MKSRHPIHAATVELDALPVRQHSAWASLLDDLLSLGRQQARRLAPPISQSDVRSLRSAARYRRRGVHVRQAPDATYVWLGGRVEGFEKYRR
jgi:hypothetical protein